MKDKKIDCPVCLSPEKCFEELTENNVKSWLCVECGYTSTSLNKNHSKELKQILSSSPQLVIDLKQFVEETETFWFPTIINMPSKGILYPDGTIDNWTWVYAPIVDVPKEEQENYPVPGTDRFYDKRLAVEQSKKFGKFYDGLKEMGAII